MRETQPKTTLDKPDRSVRDACVEMAMSIVAEKGIEALSLRSVARELGVSHQAPYKHFPSRDHLLAELIRRNLQDFATVLRSSAFDADGGSLSAVSAMRNLGFVYLDYAVKNPLAYRLMFGTPWPEIAHEVGLDRDARVAFDVLCERLAALAPSTPREAIDLDAMFVWFSIHGVATVLQGEAMKHLHFDEAQAEEAVHHAMRMIDRAVFKDRIPGEPIDEALDLHA